MFQTRALEHSVAKRLDSRRAEILFAAITLHISARAFDKAQEVLSGIEEDVAASDNVRQHDELHSHEARLALERGDLTAAATSFGLIETTSPTYSRTRRGYYLALEVHIRLKQGASTDVIRKLVEELEFTHLQMRELGAQDFESYSLYLGLCALGQEVRGAQLFREYVKLRHAKWPLPPEMLGVLEPGADHTDSIAPRECGGCTVDSSDRTLTPC